MPPIRTLTVTAESAAFILDCLAARPYREVAPLIEELSAQIRTQEATAHAPAAPPALPAAPALAHAPDAAQA